MRRYAVDPCGVAIGGFSDGASYALCVGLMNGDLFSGILAFSPGFMAPLRCEGMPRVFISHGEADQVLPVERGHAIARRLADEGYEVHYAPTTRARPTRWRAARRRWRPRAAPSTRA